jgi:hypothetical protein
VIKLWSISVNRDGDFRPDHSVSAEKLYENQIVMMTSRMAAKLARSL